MVNTSIIKITSTKVCFYPYMYRQFVTTTPIVLGFRFDSKLCRCLII